MRRTRLESVALATAPPGRWASSEVPSAAWATSAMRKVAESPTRLGVERVLAVIHAAKVGYLMPHCAANEGALRLLDSSAARTCCLYCRE